MKHLLLFFLSCCFLRTGKTQVDHVGSFNRHVFEMWKGEAVRIGPFSVKGSPYLFGEAFDGSVHYKGGNNFYKARILYDVYHQKAGVELQSMIYEAAEPVDSFTITLPQQFGGKKLFFKSNSFYAEDKKGFYNIVEEGDKVSLLKMYKSKLIADPNNNMDTKSKVFEQYAEYYLFKKVDKTLHSVKLRKKDFLNEFGDENFSTQYLVNNTVDFTREEDIAKMMNAYNQSK